MEDVYRMSGLRRDAREAVEEELLAEARRLEREQEQARSNRNRFFLTAEAAILRDRQKEARAEDIVFLDRQVSREWSVYIVLRFKDDKSLAGSGYGVILQIGSRFGTKTKRRRINLKITRDFYHIKIRKPYY